MQAIINNGVIKMHVAIGSTGMRQGLAFYQRLLLLKVLEIFNSGIFHEQTVFYAPHHSHTSIQWKQIRNNHQTVPTEQNRGKKLFYSSRRSLGYKEH
jgi:hypothetical protein